MEQLSSADNRLYWIDTGMFNIPKFGAVYILNAARKAVVEAATSLESDRVLDALDRLEIKQLDYIFITHIHLDHAGGAWVLAEKFPRAKVVVHERGAKHLADPSRLLVSVERAVGKMFHQYGTVKPISEAQLVTASGGETFDLGGFLLEAIDTPGHAPHHLCFFEPHQRILFTGDAVGIYDPNHNLLVPTTPPPGFNLEQSLDSLERLKDLNPKTLLYTHYGATNARMLEAYADLLVNWVEAIEEAHRALGDDGAVIRKLIDEDDLLSKLYDRTFTEEMLKTDVQGVLVYLSGRRRGRTG